MRGDSKIIRVFPRRTSMTPRDDYAFVGDPPLIRPLASEVYVSCAFTWDMPAAKRLADAWAQYYPVSLGGCAYAHAIDYPDLFTPGMYVRKGIVITHRGCNNQCPWCLVPRREGSLREIEIYDGNNLIDNNILQCSRGHIAKVVDMLRQQHGIILSGGLDSRLFTSSIADDLKSLRIKRMFFACDTKEAIKPLERAKCKLDGFTMDQLRCFVLLCFYENETVDQALARLIEVYRLGFMPFAMLYQPPDKHIEYSKEWRKLAKHFTRPAITKAFMRGSNG
ncbi:hypothetical protein ES707_01316 [subsurface metagenome]